MPALTRRPTTDGIVEITFVGPARNMAKAKAKALAVLKPLDFEDGDDSVPWEEVFPDYGPGDALKGARYKEAVTQRQLAEMTGIPQRHISEMENNKRPIGIKRAKILGKALNIGYKVFL